MEDNLSIPPVPPATAEDLKEIEAACRDYASGWFSADATRMRRALHPELVKRTIWYDTGDNTMKVGNTLTADAMVRYTQEGGGGGLQEFEKQYEVVVLDVFRDVATAKVSSYPYMDYLHLARIEGRWWIMNCLYKVRQGEQTHPWSLGANCSCPPAAPTPRDWQNWGRNHDGPYLLGYYSYIL